MTTDTQSPIPLGRKELLELAELLQAARRQVFEEYLADRGHERQLDPAEPGDLADHAEVEVEREALLEASAGELELLTEIEDAMERMAAGRYGACEEDGEGIPWERLQALPWARCCAPHQEAREAREKQRRDDGEPPATRVDRRPRG